MASTQHVTWAELLPVIRKALPSESEFSDAVANNIAAAVSEYLLNRDQQAYKNTCCNDTGMADYASVPCPNPSCTAVATSEPARGRGQGQRVAVATDVASSHDADGHEDDAEDDAFAAAYRAAKTNAPVAVAKLTSVHYWADPGGRGRIRTEDGYESTWTGGHYEGAAKLAAEHGLRVKRVDTRGATTWARS